MIKREVQSFFTAIMFYTRIPCPKWVDHSEEYLQLSRKYFPLIGWIVGGVSGLVLIGSTYVFSIQISVLLSMVVSVLLTGSFHEDGLADTLDGFGGGWTKEKILLIMKDSRIGTFGVVGLILVFLLKFMVTIEIINNLTNNPNWYIIVLLITAHSLSRWSALTFFMTHQYSKKNDEIGSKSKPLATAKFTFLDFIIASFFGIVPIFFLNNYYIFLLIIPVYIAKWLLGRWFNKWINGYTGDCLGATQQICEIVFYLGFIALWKFI